MNYSTTINPFYAARVNRAVPPSPAMREAKAILSGKPKPVYAKLPMAPRNASPVPGLTSLYHHDDPGPYGNRGYPGNCSGNIIKDLLRHFQPGSVYDPMSGSGTCKDVCNELGIYCYSGDIHDGFDACESHFDEAFTFCWLHPPYWRMKLYADDPRDLSREYTLEGFLKRYEQLLSASAQALIPGGRLAVLMGDYTDRDAGFVPLVYYTKLLAFRIGLQQCETDIIRFSHNASSAKKIYRSKFIPGLHDVVAIFTKPTEGA